MMNVLLIHQNFPGQFKYLVSHLSNTLRHQGGIIVALGAEDQGHRFAKEFSRNGNFVYYQYKYLRSNSPHINPWLLDFDSKIIRGESCASACLTLKEQGFKPDIVILHSGWGEGLFVDTIFRDCPILSYQEFFYNLYDYDFDFDPEFQSNHKWTDYSKLHVKQSTQLLSLHQSSWCLTPTTYQKSTFPHIYHEKFSVIHDGINIKAIDEINEDCNTIFSLANKGKKLITCVMRSVEPYRGCHTLIRAIPDIQASVSDSTHILIVGDTEGVSYGAPCPTGTWKDYFLQEITGRYDPQRVHFIGRVPYKRLIGILKLSSAHIYFTYPFVLSWSLLEAMACRCAIIGSDTAPVREVITDGRTGLLADFFDPAQLATQVARLLDNADLASELGDNARKLIEEKYALSRCLPQQMALIELVANGILKQA